MAEPVDVKEVVEAVQKEIKKLGDNSKENYDALRKNYDELAAVVDSVKEGMGTDKLEATVAEKISKLSSDITTRQDEIDKSIASATIAEEAANKRMDEIEVAMQRTGGSGGDDEKETAEMMEAAKSFMINALVVKDKGEKGATFNRVKDMEVNLDEYKAYIKSFEGFLRSDERRATADQVKALSVGIDPDGGYTVTPVMSNRVITRMFESDPIRQISAVESISTGAIEWLVDYGEAGWGWEGETETGGETDTPQLYKKRIPVHVMYAKPRATQTLLEDSGINIESWLADKVANRFLRGEAAAFVDGNGVGKPRGFLTYDDYDTAGVDQWGKVEQVAMGAAAALTADGFIGLKYSLIEQFLNRGTWMMNRQSVADAMYLKDGSGRYIWSPGLSRDETSTILGLPVRMSTTMPVVAASALSVAIADWRDAYMIVDRLGITMQRDPYTVKPYVEFYTRKRVGGDVTNFQAIKLGVISV